MNLNPEAEGAPLIPALRAGHRRVLGLFRPLENSRDDFERIEQASVICEEIRQMLEAERSVVWPLVEARTAAAHEELLELVDRLEQLSPEEAGFDPLSRQTYDRLREHVCAQERDLFPLLARLDAPALERAERRLRDLRERELEH
ncbi:MAG TPA: hemerythrin domain-containing protein [Gammaproteobacteria bacterium]|nr:hemerythrin domain-containing protein [Gammaproteobacteria bacterium]